MDTQTPSGATPASSYAARKRKNTVRGVLWLVLPLAGLFVLLTVYAVASLVITQLMGGSASDVSGGLGNASAGLTIARILRVVVGLLGIIDVVCIMVGIPIGIAYLVKHVPADGAVFDQRSGKGAASEVPAEIKGWNWGAAGLPLVWGLSHSVWLCLIGLIPIVNWVWWIVMGVMGNEWAWRKEQWESVEEFKRVQRKWMPWGIVFFILSILIMLARFGSFAGQVGR